MEATIPTMTEMRSEFAKEQFARMMAEITPFDHLWTGGNGAMNLVTTMPDTETGQFKGEENPSLGVYRFHHMVNGRYTKWVWSMSENRPDKPKVTISISDPQKDRAVEATISPGGQMQATIRNNQQEVRSSITVDLPSQ